MGSKIRMLSEQTINQIAAGEVIENPASVVKELLENAVDAGASCICVETLGGGFQLIRISDNGSGMGREDALLCLERHATSKMIHSQDLFNLKTMGFRGEALASIAAISKMTILTSLDGLRALSLDVEGGVVIGETPGARAQGTTIEVRSLFYNVPVRKKFQKSGSISSAEITKIMTQLSLSHPHIGFELIQQERSCFSLPAAEPNETFAAIMERRIAVVLGGDFQTNTFKVELIQKDCNLRGLIGSPVVHRHNRSGQYLFVNQRPVICPAIAFAIRDAYGTRLSSDRFPLYVLHLEVPRELVDVNVHPQKREIRLRDEKALKQSIQIAVNLSLQRLGEPSLPVVSYTYDPILEKAPFSFESLSFKEEPSSSVRDLAKINATLSAGCDAPSAAPVSLGIEKTIPSSSAAASRTSRSAENAAFIFTQSLRESPELSLAYRGPHSVGLFAHFWMIDAKSVVEQISFLEKERGDLGLVLIDLEAAQARVFFDRVIKKRPESQGLLIPLTLHVSGIEAALVLEYEADLSALGVAVRLLGKNTLFVESLPSFVDLERGEEMIKELIASLNGRRDLEISALLLTTRFARVHKSVFLLQEAQDIFKQLIATSSPFFCPRGKPTMIHMSTDEIQSKFFSKK